MTEKDQYTFVDGDGTVSGTPVSVSYGYNGTWQDRLDSYNGNSITYDNIGNPLTYNGWTYTWLQGRELSTASSSTYSISYLYNNSGIRTQKTVNGTVTKYNVVGGDVTWQQTGTNTPIYFIYDSAGKLWGLVYNGSTYFYVRDAQNDIIKIVDGSGNVVVQYAYDAWGNLVCLNDYTTAGTLGIDNPYRYRGYYYDTETGLYYLNSRYYNPQWGRFINEDTYGGKTGALLSHNVFIYCLNNPVMNADPSGNISDDDWFADLISNSPVYPLPGNVNPSDFSHQTPQQIIDEAIKNDSSLRAGIPRDYGKGQMGYKVFYGDSDDEAIRIDPPDSSTSYYHVHLFAREGSSLNANGNITNSKDADAHMQCLSPDDYVDPAEAAADVFGLNEDAIKAAEYDFGDDLEDGE